MFHQAVAPKRKRYGVLISSNRYAIAAAPYVAQGKCGERMAPSWIKPDRVETPEASLLTKLIDGCYVTAMLWGHFNYEMIVAICRVGVGRK